jgi:hypothetical protein
VDFYHRQPTEFAAYFEAAWRYRHRAALGHPAATLASTAADAKVSPKYLGMVWPLLEEPAATAAQEVGPIAKLQGLWRALPAPASAPTDAEQAAMRKQCRAMSDFVTKIRSHTAMQYAAPLVRGLPAASQPLLDWKLYEFADHRRDSDPQDLLDDDKPAPPVPAVLRYPGLHQEAAPRWATLTAKARAGDPDLVIPAAQRPRYEASFSRFASVFPDAFYVSERGRYFPDDSDDKGRLLSAGYHNTMGYFRDDRPLMELILDAKGKKELNSLWDQFDFIAQYTERTFVQYYFNESGEVLGGGAESGSPRPEGHAVTDPEVIAGLRDQYLAKAAANPSNDPIAQEAIRIHFQRVNDTLRSLEKMHVSAEPLHLQALLRFAARAYRRPLTKAETDDILAYYHELRDKDGLSHEDAMRDSIASVLMSPDFCYRLDLLQTAAAPKDGVAPVSLGVSVTPLSQYALASRLSYFLWASMPDDKLLAHAAAGDLTRRDVLLAQTSRMMQDARVRGLATEFGGNWLDFRRFESHNGVDRDRFPSFNNDLREAMFQEPIRFLEDAVRRNRSALDLVYAKDTFVNPSLASHYGMPAVDGGEDHWVHIENAADYGRGGLLPMAVFLTENSPGLRTSPVKRGHWIVSRLLGEAIAPPPPVVPELPKDESKSDLSVRDLLGAHRANPVCGACHAKFDSFGLALEGFGPVGEARSVDLAGRPVDTKAEFPGGLEGSAVAGILDYIRERRQTQFLKNLSRELLAYALNRSLQLSDEPLIEEMQTRLAANGGRFDTLIESIVTSPQFLYRRTPAPREGALAANRR